MWIVYAYAFCMFAGIAIFVLCDDEGDKKHD